MSESNPYRPPSSQPSPESAPDRVEELQRLAAGALIGWGLLSIACGQMFAHSLEPAARRGFVVPLFFAHAEGFLMIILGISTLRAARFSTDIAFLVHGIYVAALWEFWWTGEHSLFWLSLNTLGCIAVVFAAWIAWQRAKLLRAGYRLVSKKDPTL